jgi:hypothetical protein
MSDVFVAVSLLDVGGGGNLLSLICTASPLVCLSLSQLALEVEVECTSQLLLLFLLHPPLNTLLLLLLMTPPLNMLLLFE